MVIACLVSCVSTTGNSANTVFPQTLDISDPKQKAAYAAGYLQMKSVLSANTPLDKEVFSLGLNDALANQTPKLDKAEMERIVDWQQLAQVNLEAIKQTLLKPGRAFLALNKTQPDVKTLASGLQYKVIKSGKGKLKPKITDKVQIFYRFSKIDGSDLKKDALPGKAMRTSFVNRLPKGLQEALLLMNQGSDWQLYLPPDLVYGEFGNLSGGILPNETLLCNLELVSVELPK